MMVFVWKGKWGEYLLNRYRPVVIEKDDFERGRRIGDIVGDIQTIQTYFSEDMEIILPKDGDIKEIDFDNLHDLSYALPSYEKEHWSKLRCMLGM
jgi:hypothetical protein